MDEIHGADVLTSLAKIYQQLYIAPGDGSTEKYDDAVKRGNEIPEGDLSHFITDERDRLAYENTPAGRVCVITLYNRQDFVTFLRIMANRCTLADIPDTQGASIISGLADWTKIRKHKADFLKEEADRGNLFPDWKAEFKRFTSDKSNYLNTLIVLSVGPYSGISTERINDFLGNKGGRALSCDEWLSLSDTIRRYHECTHYVCRNMFPDRKDPVWDELVADAVGIYAAFGKFDADMEKLFLGIEGSHYVGGRLENYTADLPEGRRQAALDELSVKISGTLRSFESMISHDHGAAPFEIAVLIEENMGNF